MLDPRLPGETIHGVGSELVLRVEMQGDGLLAALVNLHSSTCWIGCANHPRSRPTSQSATTTRSALRAHRTAWSMST